MGRAFDEERVLRMRSLLAQIELLRSCGAAELDELGQVGNVVRYAPGDTIAEQSEVPTSICLVAFGRVRLQLCDDDGREVILTDIEPGGFFGDESLSGGTKRRGTAVSIGEATVVSIPADTFALFIGRHPRVALAFAVQLSRQLHTARESIAELVLLSVEDRLLHALERLAERHGSRRDDGLLLLRRPTHHELAARVGACRETVTRAFNSLSRRGLLVRRERGFLLTPEALDRVNRAA
jgi:CRP-like cAMP-binding protein